MKKAGKKAGIAVLCVVVCTAVILLCAQLALAAPSVGITADKEVYAPGESVTVTVSSDASQTAHGYQMDLIYNPDLLEYKELEDALPDTWDVQGEVVTEGTLRLLAFDNTDDTSAPAPQDASLFTVTFAAKDNASGEGSVDIKALYIAQEDGDFAASDADGGSVAFRIESGEPVSSEDETPASSEQEQDTSSEDAATSSEQAGDDTPGGDNTSEDGNTSGGGDVNGGQQASQPQQPSGDNNAQTGMWVGYPVVLAVLIVSGLLLGGLCIARSKAKR